MMLTDSDRRSLRREMDLFPVAVLNRGLHYARDGRVIDLRVEAGPEIHARVRGTK